MTGRIRRGLARLAVALPALGLLPVPLAAEPLHTYTVSAPVRYQVTVAARACDLLSQVRGGQTHGDSAESAGVLGDPAPYGVGASVDPAIESQLQQGCRPLVGARFGFGGAPRRTAALSTVAGPVTTVITTAAVPQLAANGTAVTGSVEGAVTVTLTADQAEQAAAGRLWLQGGAAATLLPANHGFGTLRCGLDTDNDDNVARIAFPAGVRHIYCIAYYASAPPATGTLVVKLGFSQPVGTAIDIGFTGDVSSRPGGAFALRTDGTAVAQQTFARPANRGYTLTVAEPPGWALANVACSGASPTTVVPGNPTVAVALAAGDTVTCEYTMAAAPIVGLVVAALSLNGAGVFNYTVAGPAPMALTATTAADGQPALAAATVGGPAPPGQYTITQTPVAGWTLAAVICAGQPQPVAGDAVTLTLAAGTYCLFRNERAAPSVKVQLATGGGTGRGGFLLSARQPDGGSWSTAIATKSDATVVVAQATDWPGGVAPGGYRLIALPPTDRVAGRWVLSEFECSGADPSTGAVVALNLVSGVTTCTARFDWRPAVELRVIRRVAGAPSTRGGQSELSIDCSDGGLARLVMAAEDAVGQLTEALRFTTDVTCTLTLTQTGLAGDDGTISSELAVDSSSGPVTLPTAVTLAADRESVVVSLTDTYSGPAADADPGIDTGKLSLKPVAVVAGALAILGALTLFGLTIAALRARRRSGYYRG